MIITHEVDKISARQTTVVLSSKRPNVANQRLLVVNHGVGQNSLASVFSGARYMLLWKTLVDAGFTLLHFDGTPAAHWGNDASIANLSSAWTWAKANLPIKQDKLSLLAFSHGNTLSYSWARQNPTQVQAIGSIIAVVNSQDIHDNDRGSLRTGIQGAANPVTITDLATTINSVTITSAASAQFAAGDIGRHIEGPGIPPGTTISAVASLTSASISVNATATATGQTATLYRSGTAPSDSWFATHSPHRFPADVAAIPQRHWISDDDPVALPSETQAFVTAVGPNASAVSFGAYNHSVGPQPLGALPRADIAAWFAARG